LTGQGWSAGTAIPGQPCHLVAGRHSAAGKVYFFLFMLVKNQTRQ
jgi:hypothetical protein